MIGAETSNILFLDIETVPLVYRYNELDETTRDLWNRKWQFQRDNTPEQHYAKAGIFAEFAKVVCIGLGYVHNNRFRVTTYTDDNEQALLQRFAQLLNEKFNTDRNLLCAHNGKEFDFPFLCRRMLINAVPLPRMLRIQGLKPWQVPHIDTMELWKFGDIKNFTSLNLMAHVLGFPSPKDDIEGSMVAKVWYENNDPERIARYCRKDVITLARVYRRFAGEPNIEASDIDEIDDNKSN